jgi:hypothetical protein
MIIEKSGKKFEKPDAGVFLGTIIDVVDLGLVASKNPQFPDPQLRMRIVWVLDKLDSEGKPYRIIEQPTQKFSDGGNGTKKSRLYEICEGVLGTAPPVPFDPETVLLGRSNALFLAKEGEYTNIKGFMPVPQGQTAPKAPADFVRHRDRPTSQPNQNAAQAAQVAQARQATAAPATAPATTTETEADVQF